MRRVAVRPVHPKPEHRLERDARHHYGIDLRLERREAHVLAADAGDGLEEVEPAIAIGDVAVEGAGAEDDGVRHGPGELDEDQPPQGSSNRTPAPSKSRTLRVTSVRP